MFKRSLPEEDLKAIKRLFTAYLAEKMNKVADKNWKEKGWTEEDMKRFSNSHLRKSNVKTVMSFVLSCNSS